MQSLHIKAWGYSVRTNIDIDDALLQEAMRTAGTTTKKATVEEGLRLLVQTRAQGSIRKLRGKIKWEGDLHESRKSRFME